jgi:YVTN family beta-propeller protein
MRSKTSNGMAGFRRQRIHLDAFCALAVLAILGLWANRASAAPFAYVANLLPASVSVIDTATNQVSATVAFPSMSNPIATAIAPDQTKVYVVGNNGSVFVMNTATNTIAATPMTVCGLPTGIAVTPDGKHAYVVCQYTSSLSIVDTTTDTVSTTITLPTGTNLQSIAITPDGLRAYVTAQAANAVFVIDTGTNTVLGTPIAVGSSPLAIAISPDGKEIYVTHSDSTAYVSVLDSASNAVVTTIAGSPYLFGVAFTPDGKFAYATGGGGVGYTLVIDTTTRAVVDTIAQGGGAIAITADGKQAYLPSQGANAVSVINTATNTLSSTISGLNLPQGVSAAPLPPGIAVPDVVGEAQAAATTAILGAGLVVGMVTQQANSSIAPGSVVSQVPAAGVLVGANAVVGLIVSSGVAVPDVAGETQTAATSAITGAALVVGTVTQQVSSTVASGSIISQSPQAGTDVAGGSAVNLVVSSGAGAGGGGGGAMAPLMLLAMLTLVFVGWRRTRSAFLLSGQQPETESCDPLP